MTPKPVKVKPFRKQRVKLVKDLSQGQNGLCLSLLDISEFENIDQVYEKKKITFNIPKLNVSIGQYNPVSEQQKQYDLTPLQKLENYKRNRMKQRYNNLLNSSEQNQLLSKKFKIRKPRIPTLLNNFGESLRKNVEEKFQGEMKKSEVKLKFFRSQGKATEKTETQQAKNSKSRECEARCKFFSLKTGKPEMNEKLFPTFEQYVEGKKRAKLQQRYQFDISKIQKGLSTFYTQVQQSNPEDEYQRHRRQSRASIISGRLSKVHSNLTSMHQTPRIMSQRILQPPTQILKQKLTNSYDIERYSQPIIEKSELSSSKIIQTMSGFYKSKNNKKQEYNNMVEYYQHDRQLTNSIRRQEYLSPEKKLQPLNSYRKESQLKRQQILSLNSKVYREILVALEKYHEDDIPVSLQILRAIRQLMRREYVFGEEEVRRQLREIRKRSGTCVKVKTQQAEEDEKEDFIIQSVINVINRAYGFGILWVDV